MRTDEQLGCVEHPLAMLASMEEALVSSSEQEESITAANDDEGTPKRLHRRSVSCSAIPESVFEGQSSDCSTGSVPGSHHASMAVAAESTADDGQQHRHHKHKHRHHHHHRRHHSQLPQQQRLQYSVSADDLPASGSQGNSGSSTPNLLAALEERPRSFTLGQHYRHQHHISSSSNHSSRSSLTPSQHGTSSHHSTASHAGLGAKPRQGSQHMPAKQQAHIAANGRRSPLQHSQHPAAAVNSKLPGQATGHVRPAGVLAGDFDSKAAAAAAPSGLGGSLVPKLQRVMSESVRPEAIAKGFAGHWLMRRSLDVFTGSQPAAPAAVLRSLLPAVPGLHLWLVKSPRGRCWVPVHLGAADNLADAVGHCLHDDGTCGPSGEPFKYKVLLDLMCRGFAVQVRFRPLKPKCSSIAQDLQGKLRCYDFPLNDRDNGGCRPIELPNGWQVSEYPIKVDWANTLYEELFGPRRLV